MKRGTVVGSVLWTTNEIPNICLLDWCYKHDTCYVLSSHQMQWIMLTSADPALVKHFKYQWCEGVYIYFDLNDLYWFYLELYDLKASKLRHVIFASLSPTSLTTSYLCWKCLSDLCIMDIWTHEYIYIKKSISFLEGNLVSVFGISAFD